MTDLLKVVITGASGRMGQTLVNLITKSDKLELVGAIERLNHKWVGQDIGVAMGGSELGVVVSEDPIAKPFKCNLLPVKVLDAIIALAVTKPAVPSVCCPTVILPITFKLG